MKIFISHSSKDKWAAKIISEQLEKIGAQTFLDEKDLRTGQSLDESVKSHLKSCNDFLILISPSSIKSEWVLIELGGALALEKTIVPVLLYVGVNEVPQIINLRLARDINDIDRYYDEIRSTISGEKIKTPSAKKIKSKFKVGDTVKIIETVPNDVYRNKGLIADWEEEMNKYLGKETVIRIDWGDHSYGLEIDNEEPPGYRFVYAEEWLTKI